MQKLIEDAAAAGHADELLKRDRRIAELETKLREAKSSYSQAVSQLEAAEKRTERVNQLSLPIDWEPWERKTKKAGKINATAILPTSDQHAEERVELREVNGLNHYDLSESLKRFQRLVRKQVEYVARYCWMAKFVVWPMLGDMINGVLRESALEANDASVMQTLQILRPWYQAAIEYQLREYKALGLKINHIDIPCVCGNHGRNYRKLGDRVAWKNSYEWGFYQGLASDWRHEPRVRFHIADGDIAYRRYFGRVVRFHHGDSIRYGGGILGLSVPVYKWILRTNTGIKADLDVFGHFHQLFWGRNFVCNGSIVGHNSYAIRIGAEYEPPSQAFILFDEEWGCHAVKRIVCIDKPLKLDFETTTKQPADEYPINIPRASKPKTTTV